MSDQTNNKDNLKTTIFKESYKESISNFLTKNTSQSASHLNYNNSLLSGETSGLNEVLFNKKNNSEEKPKLDLDKNILSNINEFSLFYNDEENELRILNDDKIIYDYLIKNYKTKNNEIEIINDLYTKGENTNNELKEIDFLSIGVFEDLSYYPLWTSDNHLNKLVNELIIFT